MSKLGDGSRCGVRGCPCGGLPYRDLDAETAIGKSMGELAHIRDTLIRNKVRCPKFLEAIRHAIRSGGGALRNARNQEARKRYNARKGGD